MEFVAESAFNLHAEMKDDSRLSVWQRGKPEGKYAYAHTMYGGTVDTDVTAEVYPKYILLRCTDGTAEIEVNF